MKKLLLFFPLLFVTPASAQVAPQADTTSDTLISDTGSMKLKSLGASATPNPGVYVGEGGASLSYQNLFSNPTGGADRDNQRAGVLIVGRTSDDMNSQEQTLNLLTTIRTGQYTIWKPSTAYTVGANVRVNGNIYRASQGGTSASSGNGPKGKGVGIADGGVTWSWINDGAVAAKVSLYNEVEAKAGGGDAWAQSNNMKLSSAYAGHFAVNTELDFENNSGIDSNFGGSDKYNLYLITKGANTSTAAIELGTSNRTKPAAIWGLHFSGVGRLASNAVIGIDAGGSVGIGFGSGAGGAMTPTYTEAAIKDASIAPTGLYLSGTYSKSQIRGTGFAIDPAGNMSANGLTPSGKGKSLGTTTDRWVNLLGNEVPAVVVVTSSENYAVSDTDKIIVIRKSNRSATAITLPTNPIVGNTIVIKDGQGDAATNRITISPATGTIDGAPTYVISTNRGVAHLTYDGTEWIAL